MSYFNPVTGIIGLDPATAPTPVVNEAFIYYDSASGLVKISQNGEAAVSAAPPGGSGTGVVNFGASPGGTTTTLVVTGQTLIAATSVVEAWIVAADTADHSIDEHLAEMPNVAAGSIVVGTGFTIYAAAPGLALYGQYSVGWRWA